MHVNPSVATTLPALPIILITGYLGAGKTSLLNRLLSEAGGRKIAVLVNDFGSINIDANLIDAAIDGVVALQNGCICCSLAVGLQAAIFKILKHEERPELIVIEASGVSNPGEIGKTLNDEAMRQYAALELVIAVLDCERILSYEQKELDLIYSQIKHADMVLLTKVDAASKDDVGHARKLIEKTSSRALILEGGPENATLDLILGIETRKAGMHASEPMTSGENAQSSMKADELYHSWSYRSLASLSETDLGKVLKALPPRTVRGKGIVYLAEYPDRQFAFQMVGKRAKIEPMGEWGEKTPRNEIVFIALKN